MANEALQWAVLLCLGFLVLGLYHQVALMMPARRRASAASGPALGDRLPREVTELFSDSSIHGEPYTVAFVTEACVGCQRLLSELERKGEGSLAGRLALIALDPGPLFRDALRKLDLPILEDDGHVWASCDVTQTPLILKVDPSGKVIGKGVTHRVDAVEISAA
ncbi:MAG: hypothetical protein JJE05_05645 [Actinobacteria bacterium]|nr:hypothetical protein [Actinomycetota bacterium]